MYRTKTIFLVTAILSICTMGAFAADREIDIEAKYLNFPVSEEADKCLISFKVEDEKLREFVIKLAPGEPDYWVYLEVQDFVGKRGELVAWEISDRQIKGFEAIYSDNTFPGGWNNDSNGMMYYKGEYHLFYQHNPFGWEWGNMTWGHAISTDMVHWVEQGDKLHADEFGTMFSGSGVVDWNNTTGFQTGDEPPLILIYTTAGNNSRWSEGKPFTQGIAYSNDRGRTWTKYRGNPVQGRVRKANRDPKVIWWEETNEWVIVLYLRDGEVAFFTSPNLKRWELQSTMESFHECPELFPLAVDGDENNKKWIHYGAHGEYLIGDFDGKKFTRETEGIRYNYGNCFYASQTFSDIPEDDGRCIQIAWGRVDLPDMPFNQMMTFPVSLTLHSTDEGLRMFAYPVKEIENIHGKKHQWKNETLKPGENPLEDVKGNLFDINAEIVLNDAEEVGLEINGFPISYNVKDKLLVADKGEEGDEFSSGETMAKLAPVDGKINLRILVDRPSIEIYANKGRIYMPMQAVRDLDNKSLKIYSKGGNAHIKELTVYEVKSIWPEVIPGKSIK
ncbi:MAG: GH32 C-terminal domain-containing protein [Planctomycetota bacterium]